MIAARRTDYIVSALTILTVMPYENGPIAMIIPPQWKPYVATIVILAGLILGEIKARQTQKLNDAVQPTDKPQ